MTDPRGQDAGVMSVLGYFEWPRPAAGERVAVFGSAELFRLSERRWELRGGTPAERAEAREWISLFLPEAVVSTRPTKGPAPDQRRGAGAPGTR